MRIVSKLAIFAFTGAFVVAGCDACGEFKNDPNKYTFVNLNDEPQGQKDAGPFVVAVYCKGTPRDAVREALEKALKDAGGGSIGDLKDEGGNYHNFARWVPYGGENTPVSFETKFASKDLNTAEPLEIVWRGTAQERSFEVNKLDNGKLLPGYPTLVEKGGRFELKVPAEYGGDKKKTLIAVTKLEERPTGGYKFKGSLPFAVRSKAKPGADIPVDWDGKDDVIEPQLESIEFFTVSGFKGDPRDLQCHLLRKELMAQNARLTFDLALSNMWFRVTSSSEKAFKVFDAGGEITGISGVVTGVEAKLPEGFPSPGKKYESRDALDKIAEKDQQPGDYYIRSESDEQTSKITYRLYIRLPIGKDPEQVDFKITVKDSKGSTQDLNRKWVK